MAEARQTTPAEIRINTTKIPWYAGSYIGAQAGDMIMRWITMLEEQKKDGATDES